MSEETEKSFEILLNQIEIRLYLELNLSLTIDLEPNGFPFDAGFLFHSKYFSFVISESAGETVSVTVYSNIEIVTETLFPMSVDFSSHSSRLEKNHIS